MSKSLRSMSESERKAAIARRLSSNTKGLGYWAAVDAQARLTKRVPDGAYCDCDNFVSDPEDNHLCGICGKCRPAGNANRWAFPYEQNHVVSKLETQRGG